MPAGIRFTTANPGPAILPGGLLAGLLASTIENGGSGPGRGGIEPDAGNAAGRGDLDRRWSA